MYIPKESLEKCGLLEPKPVQVNTPLEQLQTENEKLKTEQKYLQYNLDDWRNEADMMKARVKELEAETERLNKEIELYEENTELQGKSLEAKSEENAKLKCLALHAMREYFKAMSALNTWREDYYEEAKYLHRVIHYDKLTKQYDYAYRKAMLALMKGE